MKQILLTRGARAFVDDDVYDWLSWYDWHFHESHSRCYAARVVTVTGKKKKVWLHRMVAGYPRFFKVRFLNGDTLDCQRSNLYVERQKASEEWRSSAGNSEFIGVHWDKAKGLWNGKYDNEIDAARAVNFDGDLVNEIPFLTMRELISLPSDTWTKTSVYRGVHYDYSQDSWVASIYYKGIKKILGRRDTQEKAAAVYDAKCRQLGLLERVNGI